MKKIIETNWDELWPIVNILNEICHGIKIESFEKKIGSDYETIYILLKKISSYEVEETDSHFPIKIELSDFEKEIIIRSFRESLKQIEEWEYSTRIGISSTEANRIIEKLITTTE
ncbi:MAG: hypothetical protein WCF65_04485 [Parachlamydiaceae bacterium]